MTKLEQVARAICHKHYSKRFHPSKVDLINRNVDGNWNMFIEEAKAAIEAMKEPTEEMKDYTHLYHSVGSEFATEIYTTMIEAALKE